MKNQGFLTAALCCFAFLIRFELENFGTPTLYANIAFIISVIAPAYAFMRFYQKSPKAFLLIYPAISILLYVFGEVPSKVSLFLKILSASIFIIFIGVLFKVIKFRDGKE